MHCSSQNVIFENDRSDRRATDSFSENVPCKHNKVFLHLCLQKLLKYNQHFPSHYKIMTLKMLQVFLSHLLEILFELLKIRIHFKVQLLSRPDIVKETKLNPQESWNKYPSKEALLAIFKQVIHQRESSTFT